MLKRNHAQIHGNDLVKFGSNSKGFCRLRMMVSHAGGEALVNLKQNRA